MTGVGDFLKNHREQKGIRLEEIASITKIHIQHLELIERETWSKLPPEPFIRGFLTAYAKYVGADPRETLAKFYEGKGITPVQPEAVPPLTPPAKAGANTPAVNPSRLIEQAEPFPFGKVLVGVGAVAFVLLAGTLITIGKKAATPEPVAENAPVTETTPANPAALAPPPEAEVKPAEPIAAGAAPAIAMPAVAPKEAASTTNSNHSPKTETSAVVAEKEKPKAEKPKTEEAKKTETVASSKTVNAVTPPSEFKHVLTVETTKRTWIKVIVDSGAPIQTMSKENDKLTYSAKEKIKLVLGNPTGVKVAYNGAPTDGKSAGAIRYYRYPAHAQFPQDKPKPRAVTSDPDNRTEKSAPKTIGDWLDSPQPESRTQ